MKLLTLALAISLAALYGCERKATQPPSPKTDSPSSAPQSNLQTPSTPANAGTPTASEKKDGSNPVQGEVDPKSGAQQRDFQQRGDGAGPKSADSQPKRGG
jgi:hypothetical protein